MWDAPRCASAARATQGGRRTADGNGAVGERYFLPPALPDAGPGRGLLRRRRGTASRAPVRSLPLAPLSGRPRCRRKLQAALEKVEHGLMLERLAEGVRTTVEPARRLAKPVQAQHPRFRWPAIRHGHFDGASTNLFFGAAMPEGGEKKTLRWDEENLEFNEENKTPKMKIDEPPTPFNFDYCDDELLDDEGMCTALCAPQRASGSALGAAVAPARAGAGAGGRSRGDHRPRRRLVRARARAPTWCCGV